MKKLLAAVCCIICCSSLWCQRNDNEAQVRAVLQNMHNAWEEHDYAYSKYDIFDDSTFLINPVGMYWQTRPEITRGLQFLGAARFKYETIVEDTVLNIRFLAPTVALVTALTAGQWNQDFNMPDGSVGGTRGEISEGIYTYTLIKRDNKWKISSMHITHVAAPYYKK